MSTSSLRSKNINTVDGDVTNSGKSSGGWSEVAKKPSKDVNGAGKDELTGNFKIVVSKKKGGKR